MIEVATQESAKRAFGTHSKIVRVEPFVLRVPVRKPLATETADKGLAGVRIFTEDGLIGTGFTAPHSFGNDLFARAMEGVFEAQLIGSDPTCVGELWDKLHNSKMKKLGRMGVVSRAHAAIDIALWDLVAQVAQQPLWRILGGHKQGGIPTYVTVGSVEWDSDTLNSAIARLLEIGWRAIKIKVGNNPIRLDVKRVAGIRQALGFDFMLCVDANKAWSADQAIAFAKRVEEFDIGWLEEPCHPEDVRAHARVAGFTQIPIAVGESLYTRYQFADFVRNDAASILQPDASHVSGVTEWLAIAGLADCYNTPVIPHHGEFGQIQQHLVAATRASTMLEFPWDSSIFAEPLSLKDFRIVPPESPGASTAIDDAAFRQYRIY